MHKTGGLVWVCWQTQSPEKYRWLFPDFNGAVHWKAQFFIEFPSSGNIINQLHLGDLSYPYCYAAWHHNHSIHIGNHHIARVYQHSTHHNRTLDINY